MQDWKVVSWGKSAPSGPSKTAQTTQAMRAGTLVTGKKMATGNKAPVAILPGTGAGAKKLDEDHSSTSHAHISMDLRKVLQQERAKAGMTQKDLATAINVKPTLISDYEQGKGIPNHEVLNSIERALRVKNPSLVPGTLARAQRASKSKPKPAASGASR